MNICCFFRDCYNINLGMLTIAIKTVTPRVDFSLWESMVDHIVIDRLTKKNDAFGVFNVHSIGLSYCNTMMVIILQNLESIVLVCHIASPRYVE